MISKDVKGNEYEVTAEDLSWRPSAYGIVIRDGKILLTKELGKYHLPGGGMELGEDPKEAVVREVLEETGVVVINPRLLDLNSSFFTWEEDEQPDTFTHVHSLLLYYACEFSSSSPDDIKLDKYEQATGLTSEWVEVAKLNDIVVGTTVDWRPIVAEM